MANEKDRENGRNDSTENKNTSSGRKAAKLILLFIMVFVVIFAGVELAIGLYSKRNITPPETTTTTTTVLTTEGAKVKNPIDFKSLRKQNSDIYAWIKLDDTKVDHPVCQHPTDDSFYLRHAAEDKSWLDRGAIYTELVNRVDFTDPITVIYGHNNYGDTMFTTLHYLEDKEFFDAHPYFYIYTPNSRLTYQIISAFKYDDRHILNSFNFADLTVLDSFQQEIQNPDTAFKNVRTQLDTEITRDSKIVILSTCITNQKSNRYLVCGVLTKNEKTY